jgi:hypothetical protein
VLRRDREVADIGWRGILVVFQLTKHLLQGEAERLKLFLLNPERRCFAGGADEPQTKRPLPGLPERLGIDAASEAEFRGQWGYSSGICPWRTHRIDAADMAVKRYRGVVDA